MGKSIFEQTFPEGSGPFAVRFSLGGEIEHNEKPHDPVGI